MRTYHIDVQGGTVAHPVPNYFPLSTDDIITLLETARTVKTQARPSATGELSSIQLRLIQGIPGMEFPSPHDGPIADKRDQLDALYMGWTQNPATLASVEPLTEASPVVQALLALMQP